VNIKTKINTNGSIKSGSIWLLRIRNIKKVAVTEEKNENLTAFLTICLGLSLM